jgi:hypothetical protein
MSGSVFASNYQQSPQIWQPPAPLPTLPSYKPNIGAGASAMVYSFALSEQQQIQFLWQPPDPLPTLPPGLHAFTPGIPLHPGRPQPPTQGYPPRNTSAWGATPTYLTFNTTDGGAFPKAALATVIATGGSAVVVAIGPLNGGFLYNPPNAAAQGLVTAENLNVDLVGPPGAGDAYGNGTTVVLAPGQTFTLPAPLGANVQLWANAVTSGHKFSCVIW